MQKPDLVPKHLARAEMGVLSPLIPPGSGLEGSGQWNEPMTEWCVAIVVPAVPNDFEGPKHPCSTFQWV